MNDNNYEYAGFWVRVGASLIDTLLLVLITFPLLYAFYGQAYLNNQLSGFLPLKILVEWVFPLGATVIFWVSKSATPGKMALSLKVLDERTGNPLTVGQSIGRYLGYFVAIIPLGLGILWVGFDSKKQGLHDKLASTVVVRDKTGNVEPVRFKG